MDSTLATLTDQIAHVHDRAQVAAVQQVNYWLTARNWVVGWYLVEYEQQGSDRATYGDRLLGELARSLRARGVQGLALTNLKLCRQFYQTYPALLAHEAATWQQLGVSLPAGGGVFVGGVENNAPPPRPRRPFALRPMPCLA
jgi:hypothetical protein